MPISAADQENGLDRVDLAAGIFVRHGSEISVSHAKRQGQRLEKRSKSADTSKPLGLIKRISKREEAGTPKGLTLELF